MYLLWLFNGRELRLEQRDVGGVAEGLGVGGGGAERGEVPVGAAEGEGDVAAVV